MHPDTIDRSAFLTETADPLDLQPGDVAHGYTLIRHLGSGGFGEVWLASRPIDGGPGGDYFAPKRERQAALKFPRGLETKAFEALRREAKLLGRLREAMLEGSGSRRAAPPPIAMLEEDLLDRDPPVLAMEYVSGGNLREFMKRGGDHPLTREAARQVVLNVLEALIFANARGVIHRDLSPENILRDEMEGRWKVADFGLGGAIAETELSFVKSGQSTKLSGPVAGKVFYMAPEVQTGGKASPRSDLYSLGVLWTQLLLGRLDIGLSANWALKVPEEEFHLLEGCLEEDPADRWRSPEELREAISRAPRGDNIDAATLRPGFSEPDDAPGEEGASEPAAAAEEFDPKSSIASKRRPPKVTKFLRSFDRHRKDLFLPGERHENGIFASRSPGFSRDENGFFAPSSYAPGIPYPNKFVLSSHQPGGEPPPPPRRKTITPEDFTTEEEYRAEIAKRRREFEHAHEVERRLEAQRRRSVKKRLAIILCAALALLLVFLVLAEWSDRRRQAEARAAQRAHEMQGREHQARLAREKAQRTPAPRLPKTSAQPPRLERVIIPGYEVAGLAFANGSTLAATSNFEVSTSWTFDLSSGRGVYGSVEKLPLSASPYIPARPTAFAVGAGGRLALIGDDNGYATCWNLETNSVEWRRVPGGDPGGPKSAVKDIAIDAVDGSRVAVIDKGGRLFFLNVKRNSTWIEPAPAFQSVYSVAFSSDGELAATGGYETIHAWETKNFSMPRGASVQLRGAGEIKDIAFLPNSQELVALCQDGSLRAVDLRLGMEIYRFDAHEYGLEELAVSPDGLRVAAVGNRGACYLIDWRAGEFESYISQADPIRHAAFSPDGQSLATSHKTGHMSIWSLPELAPSPERLTPEERAAKATEELVQRAQDAIRAAEVFRGYFAFQDAAGAVRPLLFRDAWPEESEVSPEIAALRQELNDSYNLSMAGVYGRSPKLSDNLKAREYLLKISPGYFERQKAPDEATMNFFEKFKEGAFDAYAVAIDPNSNFERITGAVWHLIVEHRFGEAAQAASEAIARFDKKSYSAYEEFEIARLNNWRLCALMLDAKRRGETNKANGYLGQISEDFKAELDLAGALELSAEEPASAEPESATAAE